MTERPICDYEGSRYSTEFWTQARTYEDAVERVALKAMLPRRGDNLIEIGAGFGRMADLYAGYETVVLMDYAETQLAQAVERLGVAHPSGKPRYVYVQANFYHLPFVAGRFDAITMIRTLHHATDVPAVLRGVADILGPKGAFVLEFANKRNIKAIARYHLHKQSWCPYNQEPVEFADLNFDFHPQWIWQQLKQVKLRRRAVRTVSHFRMDFLKRHVPVRVLVALDALAQLTGAFWQLSPSVFVRARAKADKPTAPAELFFRCPACGTPLGTPPQAAFLCSCGRVWKKRDHIYDFRYPTD